MPKKYCIHLTESERSELKALVTAGKAAAPKRLRAQILLAADEDHPGGAMKDVEIRRALGVSICTVEGTRCALAEHGLQIAVHGWPPQRKISRRKVDGWTEADFDSGLLRRAAGGPFPLDAQTPRRSCGGAWSGGQRQPPDREPGAQKNELKPWQVQQWCLPPQGHAAFVCAI